MTTFINRMRGSGQTRPEGGAHAALGPARPVVLGIGVIMGATAPVPLIKPDRIHDTLLTPSLFALRLSRLVTFAVYPRFVARPGGRTAPAWALAGASALAVYGPRTTVATSTIGSSS